MHGFDTHVFHSLCDKRGPSVTIVTLASGVNLMGVIYVNFKLLDPLVADWLKVANP